MNTKYPGSKPLIEQLASSWIFYAIIATGAFLRLVALRSDPPLDLAKGQSLWTDPSQYVFFARNLVEFGKMDCFDPSGLVFFKYSFISFLSIPLFYIFSPGFWQSNLVSSIISIATIVIFGLTVKRSLGNIVGCVASLFTSVSYIFVMHNRVPYLENASQLFLAISSYYFILKYNSKRGLYLSGFFLACSLLIGKTLAVLTIPAFVLCIILLERREKGNVKIKFNKLVKFSIGFLAFSFIAMILFYLPNFLASREYLAENVINYYGFPDGLKSISGFVKSLYTFDLVNFENTFFDRLPIIAICAVLFLAIIRLDNRRIEECRAIFFFALWFGIGYLFLSPWNYRPIRYEMYLVLPMMTLATLFLRDIASGEIEMPLKRIPLVIIPMSLITFHIYFNISHASQNRVLHFWQIFGYSLILAVFASVALFYILKGILKLDPKPRIIGVLIIIVFSLSFDVRYFISWKQKLTYAIDYANRNIERQLGDKAVLVGPYAQTLTLSTSKKAEIFYFGAYPQNDSLFARIPATHVIYEVGMGGNKSGNETKFAENYSKVNAGSIQIDSYLIGRYYVSLYNISSGTDNPVAKNYKMTDFERGMYYYNRNDFDSALVYLNLAETRDNVKRASLYIGNIYYRQGQYASAKIEYAKGLADDCYDPKFWAFYSISSKQMGDNEIAEMAKAKAIRYAPFPGFFQNINF
jgi:hypothetical protein